MGNKKTFLCRWVLLLMKMSAVLKRISLWKCSPPSRLREPQKTSWTLPSSIDPDYKTIQTAGVTQAVCPATTSLCWTHIFPREPVQRCPGMTVHLHSEKLTWIALRSYSSIRGWHVSAMAHLSWGTLSCQSAGHGGRSHILSHIGQMWNTCSSAGARYPLIIPSANSRNQSVPAEYGLCTCHGVRNADKNSGTVLDTQERIRWEGAEKSQAMQHYQPAALILLGYFLYLCIHCPRAWQGRGVWEKKEMDGWVKDRSSRLSWKPGLCVLSVANTFVRKLKTSFTWSVWMNVDKSLRLAELREGVCNPCCPKLLYARNSCVLPNVHPNQFLHYQSQQLPSG